ncbi:MAG: hypothetical protein OEU84_03580 [Xanthomonadales bacterium]|nr:hypothetical protein [Xanthomonadales bacterium]
MKWNRIQIFSTLLLTGFVCVIAQAASLSRTDIPSGSNWYVHVNLDLIQNSEVGRRFLLEKADEVLNEIQEELKVDIRGEIQGVTVFGGSLPKHGDSENDGAVILHGAISAQTQDALLSALESKGADVIRNDSTGLAYYMIEDGDGTMTYTDEDGQVRDVDWGQREDIYFSFGATQTMITQNLEMMQSFLDSGGYLGGFEVADSEALLVLQADRALLQGGANTSAELGEDWDSSVLKNVDAVALVIAEDMSGLQINAQLSASSPEVAMSVRNIVEGLVALKALDDSDAVLGEILRQVRFESEGSELYMNVPVATDQIEALRNTL